MDYRKLGQVSFHGSMCLIYLYSIISYEFIPPIPYKKSHEHFAGRLKYLTYWNLMLNSNMALNNLQQILQCLFFGLCASIDLQKPSSQYNSILIKLRDKMYAAVAMPLGMFVSIVFWTLFIINRDLIFPKSLDLIFPAWLNHTSHTVIVPVLLIETIMLKHSYPSRKAGFTVTLSIGAIYILWILYLAMVKDIWVYPVLAVLNWSMKMVFFTGLAVLIALLYIIGEMINLFVWGQDAVQKKK